MRTPRALFVAAGLWFLLVGSALGQSLRVVAPNDGSPVTLGEPLDIRWTSSGVTQPLRILLFRNGERLGVIASDVPVASGSYRWIAGNYGGGTAPEGEGYSILIRVQGDGLEDSSDREFALRAAAGFTIPGRVYTEPASFRVDAPRAGERLAVGSRVEIRWTSPTPSDSGCGNTVRISAVRQGDGRVTQLAASRDNRSGTNTYSWYITPPIFADLTGDYKIRISGANASCLAESGVFALTYDTAGDVNPSGPPDESPDPIDVSIRVGGLGSPRRILNGDLWDRYRVYITVQVQVLNRRPSGAPIKLKEITCRWTLEEDQNRGAGWRPCRPFNDPNNDKYEYLTGTFKLGPLQSGQGEIKQVEIVYIHRGLLGGGRGLHDFRYRFSFELDPDRTLQDPNRNDNIAYSAVFQNPSYD